MSCLTSLAVTLLFLADGPPTALDIVSALETATTQAIARAQPSVVAITRIRGDDPELTTAIRGQHPDRLPPAPRVGIDGGAAPGSPGDFAAPGDFSAGVVVGDRGEILTTYHTLRGAERIWVRANKQEFEAEILAADPRSDLAMIAPRAGMDREAPKLPPLKIGDAVKMKPGTFLIALGNSYNAGRDGRASASMGILANTARRVHAPPVQEGVAVKGQFFRYQPTLLQLDSKLNTGMSGGAVINMRGELVGLTTAAASPVGYDVQAGYAIPMDALGQRIVETMKLGKEVEYGFLGVSLQEDVPNAIKSVSPGTPADRANLLTNDLILAVNDRPLDPEDGVTMALANVPAGETVRLKILRGGKVIEAPVLVSKYPVAGPVIASNRPDDWRGLRVDFTSALNPDGRNVMDLMAMGGIGVVEVRPGSAVDQAGLKKGTVITEVNGQPVVTPADFTRAVNAATGKDVTLTLSAQFGDLQGQKVLVKK